MTNKKAMYVVDRDYKILYCNKYFKEKYPNALEGSVCYKALNHSDMPCEHCPRLNLKNESTFYDLKTNSWVNANSVDLDDGNTAIFFKSWIEQKNIDQVFDVKISDVIKSLEAGNIYQGVLVASYEKSMNILYANNKMLEMLGYSSYDEFMSITKGKMINLMSSSDASKNQEYGSLVQEGLIYSTIYDVKAKSGEFIKVFVKAQVIKDESGRLVIVSLVTDLSDTMSTKAFVENENRSKIEQNQLINYVDEVFPGGYHKCLFDKDLTIVEMSSRFLDLTGYSKNDIINKFGGKYINLIHPDDLKDIVELNRKKHEINELQSYTYRLKHKTKGYIWVNNTSRFCEVNKEKFFQSAVIDVTDNVNKQFELEKQNFQLNLVLGNIPGGFNICYNDEKDYEYIYISNELANLLGYKEAELRKVVDNKAINLSLREDLGYLDIMKESLKESGDFKVRFRIKCKDGSLKSVINYGKGAYDKDGRAIIYSFILDITEEEENKQLIDLQNRLLEHEREKAIEREKILQQSELIQTLAKDFTTVLCLNMDNGVTSLVYTEDREHQLDMMEKYYLKHLYPESMEAYIRDYVFYDDRDSFRENTSLEAIKRHMDDSSIYVYNYRKGHSDNPEYYQVKAVRVGTDDSPLVIIGYKNVDEQQRNQIKQQMILSDALSQAQYANRAKTTFLSNMSHDIRTPMNAIIGYTALAATHLNNQNKVKDYLKKINQSSTHLLSLINDVLDMSRIESGKIKIDNQPERLSDIIHNVRNIIQNNITSRGLELYIDTVDVVHENIYCDKLRLNQVLINLLSNSMKFTKPGGIISLRIIEKGVINNMVNYEFIVKDTGIGMSKDFVEHIFEPFVREKSSTVSGIIGTGLGMSITKSIVDMLNGRIAVNSELNKGTEFTIDLAFELTQDKDDNSGLEGLKGTRALVVDSDSSSSKNTSGMLQEIGIRGEWTMLGEEAIAKAIEAHEKNDPYTTYIIDLMLPDINAIELAKRIRALDGNSPIIILTSVEDDNIEGEGLEALATKVIAKPVFLSDLRRALRLALNPSLVKEEEKEDLSLNKFKNKRLLLAEDNQFNQEIAIEILSNMGFRVEAASNGKIAIDMLVDHEAGYYDCILMDIQMPIMDGLAATRIIRDLDNQILKNIPIIAMTANAFKEDEERALECGMNGFISKPVKINKIISLFEKLL